MLHVGFNVVLFLGPRQCKSLDGSDEIQQQDNVGAEKMVLDYATLVAPLVGLISLLLHSSALLAPSVVLISLLL